MMLSAITGERHVPLHLANVKTKSVTLDPARYDEPYAIVFAEPRLLALPIEELLHGSHHVLLIRSLTKDLAPDDADREAFMWVLKCGGAVLYCYSDKAIRDGSARTWAHDA